MVVLLVIEIARTAKQLRNTAGGSIKSHDGRSCIKLTLSPMSLRTKAGTSKPSGRPAPYTGTGRRYLDAVLSSKRVATSGHGVRCRDTPSGGA